MSTAMSLCSCFVLSGISGESVQAKRKRRQGDHRRTKVHCRITAGYTEDAAHDHGSDAHSNIAADIESGNSIRTAFVGGMSAGNCVAGGVERSESQCTADGTDDYRHQAWINRNQEQSGRLRKNTGDTDNPVSKSILQFPGHGSGKDQDQSIQKEKHGEWFFQMSPGCVHS